LRGRGVEEDGSKFDFPLVSRQERDITRLVSDDLLLTQSIFITDKFGFDESKASRNVNNTETPFIVANYQDACINSYGKALGHLGHQRKGL